MAMAAVSKVVTLLQKSLFPFIWLDMNSRSLNDIRVICQPRNDFIISSAEILSRWLNLTHFWIRSLASTEILSKLRVKCSWQ